VLPNDVKENNTFATTNAIQVRIDENVRMLVELHARWEREDEMARRIFFENPQEICALLY
jgi:hypothetical protein